ncbi:MAG: hypothetical protein FD153_1146 [Rhodospirillaceae bacterium]|nr:MAG: hypothetical protein FD153_1146 [Rhodospirillaceae bacterium]
MSYATLVRNIELSSMENHVDAYCLAFNDRDEINYLYMANTTTGHSCHAFGQKEFMTLFRPPVPHHVKLDVDSIEARVLKGARWTLAEHVQMVLVKIDGSDKITGIARGRDICGILAALGFLEDGSFRPIARRNVGFCRSP